MSIDQFENALSTRRSVYALAGTSAVPDAQIVETIKKTVADVPSAFNAKPQRVVVLFGDAHRKVWDFALEALKAVTPAEQFEQSTKPKVESFAAAHGTVLYFDDVTVTEKLAEQFPPYAANFPLWAEQAQGSVQFAVWTALSELGLGANLQHYTELIEAKVKEAFDIPATWKLTAQQPFGDIAAPAAAKQAEDIDERVKVLGL